MSRRALGLILGLFLLVPGTFSLAQADTVVFDKTYTVGWPTVLVSHDAFSVNETQEATCVVTKVDNGKKFKSGFLWLNDKKLLGENDLHGDKTVFEVPVTLKKKNNLWIYWHGQKGSAVTVEFRIKKQALPPTASLTVDPTAVTVGNSATLTWTSQNADTVTIDNGIGQVPTSGSLSVTPAQPTTYTLTAANAVGQATAQASIRLRADVAPQPEGSFGAQYQDLIPWNTKLASYDAKRFALVTGRVLSAAGTPLPGVTVSVAGRTEYGSTHTDADGRYNLPLESTGSMTVVYSLAGYLPAQRTVPVRWNDTAVVEDTLLLMPDAKTTSVIFNGNPGSVMTHESSPVTDAFGKRSATLVFTGDNKAFEVDASGNTLRELTEVNVSTTEFTTPASMPAKLPPTSAFTWCADMVVDGASRVRFDKPVIGWLDNFLGFEVGTIVPVGYYDRDKAVWVPSDNGLVVKLLDTNGDGVVDALDADGDGQPDDLNGDGSFVDEVEGLSDSTRYKPGETYWRFSMSHFTPWDCNFPYGPAAGDEPPNPGQNPDGGGGSDDDDCKTSSGSSVSNRMRFLHEDIPVPGTDLTVHYASDRVPGYKHIITVPVSGATVPATLKSMTARATIAGRVFEQVLPPEPNKTVEFVWDGLDQMGEHSKAATAQVEIGFTYDAVYYKPDPSKAAETPTPAFARLGDIITAVRTRQEYTVWKQQTVTLNRSDFDMGGDIAQGWTLSVHHRMNPVNPGILYKGDGSILKNAGKGPLAIVQQTNGTNGPTLDWYYQKPIGISPDGMLYVGDAKERIYRMELDGRNPVLIAGGGTKSVTTTPIEALTASLGSVKVMRFAANGSLYMVSATKVFRLDTDGTIRVVAGNGSTHYNGDGIPATAASLYHPNGLAVDAQGNLYIADQYNNRIRKVDQNGIITTFAGTGAGASSSCPPADVRADTLALGPFGGMDIDAEGRLLVGTSSRLYRIEQTGNVTVLGGCGKRSSDHIQPNTSITSYINFGFFDIKIDNDGGFYVVSTAPGAYCSILRINSDGIVSTIAGKITVGTPANVGFNFDIPAESFHITVAPNGDLFYTDNLYKQNTNISRLAPSSLVINDDNGQRYVMSSAGQHLRTEDQETGKTIYSFGYDAEGNLTSVTDRFGAVLTIERSGDAATAIVSPDGQRMALSVNDSALLTQAAYQDGGAYGFNYDAGGLLLTETDPNGNHFVHAYDANGRVSTVSDPLGGKWTYTKSIQPDHTVYEETTAEGLITTYEDQNLSTGYFSTIIDPSGGETAYSRTPDEKRVTKTTSCGWTFKLTYADDPRFFYPYEQREEKSTPSGLKRVTESTVAYTAGTDNTLQSILRTVTVNSKASTLRTDLTTSTRVLTTPAGRTATVTYDPTSLLTASVAVPGLATTNLSYDARGRISGQSAGTRSVTATYDTAGNVASVTDPRNLTTSFAYDDLGRRTAIFRPDNSVVRFTYDKMGNMIVLTTPANVPHDFEYNAVNRNSAYVTPRSGSYVYSYDRDRRLTKISFPSGKAITRTYQDAQLASVAMPEGTVNYTYETCGSTVKSLSFGTEGITYGHDGPLVTSVAQSGTLAQTISYAYNSDFKVKSLTYAGSANAYTYDNDNLLTGSGGYTIGRDSQNGLPISVAGNGFSESRTFNQYGEPDGWTVTVGGQTAATYALTRDAAGNIATRTETVAGESHDFTYTYDNVGRLTQVTRDGTVVERYAYAGPGTGRTSETNTLRGLTNRTYAYDDEDHLTSAGDASFTYDKDGFLTGKTVGSQTTGYTYSSRGELLRVDLPDGTVVEYVHDPLGRRIAKKVGGAIVEKYLWQGRTRLLAVYDGSGSLKQRFEYADARLPVAMTVGSTRYFLVYDQVGSLRAVTDGSGSAVKTVAYDSFGNVITDSNAALAVPFGFAGGLFDTDTGLTRFGFRDYDADVGRWTAKDPILFEGGDTDLYGYVVGDPINRVDPIGKFASIVGGAVAGAIGGSLAGAITGAASAIITGGNASAIITSAATSALIGGAVGAVAGGLAGAGIVGPLGLAAGDFFAGAMVGGDAGEGFALGSKFGTAIGIIADAIINPKDADGSINGSGGSGSGSGGSGSGSGGSGSGSGGSGSGSGGSGSGSGGSGKAPCP
ncbi:YD repeat protein [Solidesulfovibrio fructosivorans JJ]]|uniref:YD repeat protein n=1 Tax=Solidesulfovibrio fructosivorans JJ] TaxID=596151 RepID=E1K0Z4_SOLFR|nr:RHS repeat-associated core domain-containing protein [Solidesulfovibrio fructosivorans]EFL49690.1 YD repeat protein [Solidesulfovibrio fructosivorans JJ]]